MVGRCIQNSHQKRKENDDRKNTWSSGGLPKAKRKGGWGWGVGVLFLASCVVYRVATICRCSIWLGSLRKRVYLCRAHVHKRPVNLGHYLLPSHMSQKRRQVEVQDLF